MSWGVSEDLLCKKLAGLDSVKCAEGEGTGDGTVRGNCMTVVSIWRIHGF